MNFVCDQFTVSQLMNVDVNQSGDPNDWQHFMAFEVHYVIC